jgi:predicted DNA-binding transcriptional regulator YafY
MKLISLSIPMDLSTGTRSIHATLLDGNSSVPVSIADDHPNWAKALKLVNDLQAKKFSTDTFAAAFHEVVSIEKALTEKFTRLGGILDGRMSISSSGVTVDYEPIDPVLESHILRMLEADGTPRDAANWRAFSKFIENLYANQDDFVRKQLFGWMSFEDLYGTGLTLTEDGCFIGYKGCMGTPEAPTSIRTGHAIADGVDYNGHIPNKLGSTVEMPRSEVVADPAIGCGPGLHVGTHKYAKSWAQGVLLTVKVNPRDVVSVPVDCSAQKIRTCRYEVIEIVEEAYTRLTYSASASKPSRPVDEEVSATISEAVETEARVKISYVDTKGQASIRTIVPSYVLGDVVTAWCETANGDRSFKLSEIRSAEILDESTDEDSEDETPYDFLEDLPFGSELRVEYIDSKGVRTDRQVTFTHLANDYFVGTDLVTGKPRTFKLEGIQALDYEEEDTDSDECNCGENTCDYELSIEDLVENGIDLKIVYTDAQGVTTIRVVTPDRFVDEDSDNARLVGYCHTADGFRTFLVSSIQSIELVPNDEDDELDPEAEEEIARNGYSDSPSAW